ncbi:hypothetical protein CVS40_10937 [Lucilia cuprina]|nr:hypothetical protein CVS40_10937 [Lucilia cuprina]
MDLDIKQKLIDTLLSDNSTFEISNKIVHNLSTHFAFEYKWHEMENIIKMFVLYFESQLLDKNENRFFQQLNETAARMLYDESINIKNVMPLTMYILRFSTFIKNGVIFDNILNFAKKCNIGIELLSYKEQYLSINRKKMYAITERIFLLPLSNIENAIQRIIMNVSFEILGYIFCEYPSSMYFDKFTILGDIICNEIKHSGKSVKNFLIPSILLVSCSEIGKPLYEKCLKNHQFCSSLNIFFKNYLRNLMNLINNKPSYNVCGKYYAFSHIIYMQFIKKNKTNFDFLKDLNSYENKFINEYLSYLNILYI